MRQPTALKQAGKGSPHGSITKLLITVRPAVVAAEREWKTSLRQKAPEFCALSSVSPDENQLSELIAALLDPRGSHGQGDIFLKRFAGRCGAFGKHPLHGVTVHRESHTIYIEKRRRRLDILIDGGHWGVGIENKPWANEQIKQLQDYSDDLEKRYKGSFLLIRLVGRESEAKSFDPGVYEQLSAGKKFVTWQYVPHLLGWLTDCRKRASAARVIGFLDDFSRYLVAEFVSPINQRKAMEQKHLIPALESILKAKPAQLSTIAAIAEQFPVLRQKMVERLFDEVQKAVLAKLEAGWFAERSGEDFVGEDWAALGFTHKKWRRRYWVRLESQPKYGTVALGIWHNRDVAGVVRNAQIAKDLRRLGWGKKAGGPWWQGFSPLDEPFADWYTALGFAKVFEHREELKADLIEEFVKLCSYFEKPLAKLVKGNSSIKIGTE